VLSYLTHETWLALSCLLFIVVEVESALRHKAKLERHQRTAERAVYSNAIAMLPSLLVCFA
jgi:hypothetical protein